MTSSKRPEAPQHLSRRSKAFWRKIVGAYELEPEHLEILQRACEAMDRVDQARDLLDRDGLTTEDRWGQVKPHPAATIEVQNRRAVAALLRELHLGEEPAASRSGSARDLARKRWSA